MIRSINPPPPSNQKSQTNITKAVGKVTQNTGYSRLLWLITLRILFFWVCWLVFLGLIAALVLFFVCTRCQNMVRYNTVCSHSYHSCHTTYTLPTTYLDVSMWTYKTIVLQKRYRNLYHPGLDHLKKKGDMRREGDVVYYYYYCCSVGGKVWGGKFELCWSW